MKFPSSAIKGTEYAEECVGCSAHFGQCRLLDLACDKPGTTDCPMNNGAPDASGLLAIGVTTELPMVGIFGLDFQLDFKCDA